MTKKKYFYFVVFALVLLLLPIDASSAIELPIGLQKIIESNQVNAENFLAQVSFPLVFIAGILSLLSPCILPTVPAFFAVTFKSKEKIAKKTFVFFSGFASVFVVFGLVGASIGQTLGTLQINYSNIVMWAGLFIIVLGIMSVFGKGLDSLWKPKFNNARNDNAGIWLFGASFGIGWTACLGPILAAIILMASVMQNYFFSGLLLLTYSLGLFVPLFVLALFFDKSARMRRWIRGRELRLEIGRKVYISNSIQVLSGLILIIIGSVFIIYKGTGVVNSWNFFGLKDYFYIWQNALLHIRISNWWLLILLPVLIIYIRRKNKQL